MEGLEISENNFSDLCSQELIFGSEFNSQKKEKALLKLSSSFKVNDFFQLKSNLVTKINRDSLVYDLTHSIGNFLQEGEIENEIRSAKKEVVENDFIISRLRSYLKEFAVVQHNKLKQLVSSEYLVYSQTDKRLSPNSLLAFCLTDEVQTIFNCSQYGTEHPRLYDFVFDQLPIPECLLKLNNEIDNLFSKAYSNLKASKQLYAEAEAILLSELGLNDWTPENKSVSIKSFSDFTKSGRLDAEYYQPKYDDLFAHLQQFECRTIGQISNIKKSIEPGSEAYQDSGIPFIRVSNITKFGLTDPEIHLDKTIFADELKPKKNTILLTKDGSVGIAYKVSKDLEAITSGALLHINITDKYFLPDYVTLVINSIVVKLQAERDAGGSIIQHWKPSEIAQVIIPKLPLSLQSQIANKIQTSFSLKSDSKALLERAKQMVENEIEKN